MTEIEKITNGVEMDVWIERENLSPFIMSLFHHLEGPISLKIIGAGFTNQINFSQGKTSYMIRPKIEIKNLPDLHRDFITESNPQTIKNILNKSLSLFESSDNVIKEIANSSEEVFEKNLQKYLREISDILLYTTTIAYFLMSSLEGQDLSGGILKEVHEVCEKPRSDSKYFKVQNAFLPKLVNYLKSKGFDQAQAETITYDEFLEVLKGQYRNDQQISQRKNEFVFWLDNKVGKNLVSYDPGVINYFKNKFVKLNLEDIKEIKGSVANKGQARGRVSIVNSPEDLHKMREGDILVSRNTNPSLMAGIKICSAIVTDEGGIACHASIVSRELNKPCVVGTKIATKVLKDGDIIEVDTKNGIVKILK